MLATAFEGDEDADEVVAVVKGAVSVTMDSMGKEWFSPPAV